MTKILVNFLDLSIALTRKVVNMENKKSRPSSKKERREDFYCCKVAMMEGTNCFLRETIPGSSSPSLGISSM